MPSEKIPSTKNSYLKDYFSAFSLTIINPATILVFMAVFGILGIGGNETFSVFSILIFVFGAFLGSATWYLILCTGIDYLSRKLSYKILSFTNKISGVIIGIFGVLTIIQA